MRRTVSILAGAIVLAVILPGKVLANDSPTFHGDNTRQGNDSVDGGLGDPTAAWTSQSLDGQLYAQPLVYGNEVIQATENNSVYALNATTGAIIWARNLGAPRTRPGSVNCGNINPQGITSTPVIDGGNVYVVANIQSGTTFHFQLTSINAGSGAVNWSQNIEPSGDNSNPSGTTWSQIAPNMEDRGALLASNGKIFVPLGGNDGDCGSYHGYVVSYPESGSGTLNWWASTEVSSGNKEGAVWAAGGLSQDTAGYIYAPTGNSYSSSGSPYDYSDGVIKLDPNNLNAGAPFDYFAPSNWLANNAADADLGSTTPVQLPNNRAFITGKSGVGYLLNTSSLGHIGGQVAAHQVCHASNGAAFASLAYANGVVFVGCSDGMTGVQVNGNDFTTLWYNTTTVANHPPTVAGGVVWAVDSSGGKLDGFDLGTGTLVHQFAITGSNHFTTPSAGNNYLFVSAGTQVDAFSGGHNWSNPPSESAFQANTGSLYTYDTGGSALNTTQGMAQGTSPAICPLTGGGYEIAFQANTGQLFMFNSVSKVTTNTGQGMAAGTSPSIGCLTNGGYEIAFQANNGHLYLFSSTTGPLATTQGMTAGSNPGITGLADGGFEATFSALGINRVYFYSSRTGAAGSDQGVQPGTSPAIAGLSGGGWEVAFAGAGVDRLFGFSSVSGPSATDQGMEPGTNPGIAGTPDGAYEMAFAAAGSDNLYVHSPGGTAGTTQGIAAGTSPSIMGISGASYQVSFQASGSNVLVVYAPTLSLGVDSGLGMMNSTGPGIG